MTLLQISETGVVDTALSLADKGLLGLGCLVLGASVIFLFKINQKSHEENKARILKLEDSMERYLAEDRKLILETIDSNTRMMENNNKIMEEFLRSRVH